MGMRPTIEVADIIRVHGESYLEAHGQATSPAKRRILQDLAACRTAALGGHVERCDRCSHQEISYNSCRNRHCPKCQASARAEWLEARQADLLPVEYFHVVFTVPAEIAEVGLQNKRVVYGILFSSAAETLLQIAADPKHLGAEIGFMAVLHTWGQNLLHHPHVHCVVPGGGLASDGSNWVPCRLGFFLPVRVLSRVFRGKFLQGLKQAFDQGELSFQGCLEKLNAPAAFSAHLIGAASKEWVVYAKPPFGGPQQVLKYLARYTHRVAISNRRILAMEDGNVSFSWKDYAHGNHHKVMTLEAHEFIRRFLLHALPRGFHRLRHFGFLANRQRAAKLEVCRNFLGQLPPEPLAQDSPAGQIAEAIGGDSCRRCPACKEGRMVRFQLVPDLTETFDSS
jgi:hypothetical protein